MRKALNANPVVQVALLGGLGIFVAFMVITRLGGGSSSGTATTPTPAATTPTAPSASTTPAAAPTPPSASPTAPTAPSATGTVLPSISAVGGKMVAGPGLPKPVANAYADGKAIVLLIFRKSGIDDAAVRAEVDKLKGDPGLAVFVIHATQIGRFSRIAEGVNVDRVPALIVIKPKKLSHGTPTASVDYGFRSAASIEQAVRDALYKGRTDLPYYPR